MGLKLQVEKPTIFIVSLLFAIITLFLSLTAFGFLPGELWTIGIIGGIFGIVGFLIISSELFFGLSRKNKKIKFNWNVPNIVSLIIAIASLGCGIYLLISGGFIEASRYLIGTIYLILVIAVMTSLFTSEHKNKK